MIGEAGGEEPHYEFAPLDSADEEHIYDVHENLTTTRRPRRRAWAV